MKLNRFGRDYEIVITTKDEQIIISPPFRISFTATKKTKPGESKATIRIYNLANDTRMKLLKDDDDDTYIGVILKVGYDDLYQVFKGNIYATQISRSGADIITTISCIDGGHDLINSFTAKTVKSKKESINAVVADMPHTSIGKITDMQKTIRPRVIVGNSVDMLTRSIKKDMIVFFDDEKINILKDDEVVDDSAVVISGETGMIGTPVEQDNKMTVQTMLNPIVRLRGLVEISSSTNSRLNGLYIVNSITYQGDFDGKDWKQSIECERAKNYKVLK